MSKVELLQMVDVENSKPILACVEIAKKQRHTVYFTPPYHPELQPIEKIWAVAKNAVVRSPAKTMAELKLKICHSFDTNVTESTWCGSYKAVQRQEDTYADVENELEQKEEIVAAAMCKSDEDSDDELALDIFEEEILHKI